jgi:hypothetical protein
MSYIEPNNYYQTHINQLNDAIKNQRIKKIKSSIAPRYSDFLGKRGYRIEFDKNFDGEIPQNSEITLYDTRGNETKDSQIIINYLEALTKKINEQGLSKKDGFLSEFFDKLSGGINFVEDLARNLTKFSLNYCVVKPVVKFIDFVANTNIHQKLKDNHYFDIDRETKGVYKFFDPSKLVSSVCNLAFRPTRSALRLVDKVTSIFIPINSQSHYLPTITQNDLDKTKQEKTRRSVSSKSASHGGVNPNLTRSRSLPARTRTKPQPQAPYNKSNSVGQPSSAYWTPTNQRDLFPSYDFNPPLAPTLHPSHGTLSAGGNRYDLNPEQTSALFEQARSQAKSRKREDSSVYRRRVHVTPAMPVLTSHELYNPTNQNGDGRSRRGGRRSGREGGGSGRGGCGR